MHTHNRSFRACNPMALGRLRAEKAWLCTLPYPTLLHVHAMAETQGQQYRRRQQRQRRDPTGKSQHCASSRAILQPDVSTALKLLTQAACFGVQSRVSSIF